MTQESPWMRQDNTAGNKEGREGMPNPSSPLRVLIVDDEPLISWALASVLVERGDDVTEAITGEEAIRALADAPEPDVVLLDFDLPDSHDLKLLSTVRRLAPHSRVILLSAWATQEVAEQAMALGAYRVVNKPVDMRDIPVLVSEAADSTTRLDDGVRAAVDRAERTRR